MLDRRLYENLVTRISKVVKQHLNEAEDSTTTEKWLASKYGGPVQSLFDPVQNYAIYQIPTEDIPSYKERLKASKCISKFRTVKNKNFGGRYSILCFYYDRSKDKERDEYEARVAKQKQERERREKEQFDREFAAADTDRFVCTKKDMDKMKGYYNKRSDPEKLVKSIKDNNKLVARWIAAMKLDWEEAVEKFGYAIIARHILSRPEMAAYKDKYKNDKDKTGIKTMTGTDADLSTSWITGSVYRFFNELNADVQWLEVWKSALTSEGKEAMHRNGRAWTEGFVVSVNGKKIVFDIITNEGGGLYGYALEHSSMLTLKQFKERIKYECGLK